MKLNWQQGGWVAPSHCTSDLKHQCNNTLSWFQADSGKPTAGCSYNFGLCVCKPKCQDYHNKARIKIQVG